MNTLESTIRKSNLSLLNLQDIRNINGGDKLSEDVFRAAGYIWQSIKNLGAAILERNTSIAQDGTHPGFSHNGGLK